MKCPATLEIGDDYGDNYATMHCDQPEGHDGPHSEIFFDGRATVTWTDDPVAATVDK